MYIAHARAYNSRGERLPYTEGVDYMLLSIPADRDKYYCFFYYSACAHLIIYSICTYKKYLGYDTSVRNLSLLAS